MALEIQVLAWNSHNLVTGFALSPLEMIFREDVFCKCQFSFEYVHEYQKNIGKKNGDS
jgi:hypothetical protein